MEVDKLLIVAHPDDEVLWGGLNLLLHPGWFVVCASHVSDPVRSREFYKTMSFCNVTKYVMYDVKEEYTDDETESDRMFHKTPFEDGLRELSRHPWKLVLTHNDKGEYGHEHHRTVHRLVMKYFPTAKTFGIGPRLSESHIELKRNLLVYYKKTQAIAKKIFDKKANTLRKAEREHFFYEPIYVTPKREVPKVVHQIWFGKPLEKTSIRYNLMQGVRQVAERNGYTYKLWTNEHLKEEMLPITWESIQTSIEVGEELEQVRFAQVADLARYEILHRFGGVYLDSLFEISDDFCKYIESKKDHEVIVANEDPCGLQCNGFEGRPYVSNGFFACVPGCMPLKRLLHPSTLSEIDFYDVHINRQTGPYFFRMGIKPRDKVDVIDTEKIYPFMVNDSEYRKGAPNQCVTADNKILHDCLKKKYPTSLAVYQSGFGGSWSW
jgi:LmbE family N-acetylglucosaminyl deacetylase